MSSKTPRTDDQATTGDRMQYNCVVSADFARQLETQLNACASMLGIVDVDIDNADIPAEQVGAWMQGRIAELQEGNANAVKLEAELADTNEQLQSALNPVHTCGANCKRVECVLRRERDQLKAQLDLAIERVDAKQAAYHGCAIQNEELKSLAKELAEVVGHIGWTSCERTDVLFRAEQTLSKARAVGLIG